MRHTIKNRNRIVFGFCLLSIVASAYEDYQIAAQRYHNERRKEHKVGPLDLWAYANGQAVRCAEYYVLNSEADRDHDCKDLNLKIFMENVHRVTIKSKPDLTPLSKEASQAWYDEVKKYNFASPHPSAETTHFTQMVWKSSTHLGIGAHYETSVESAVVVALYYRPDNPEPEPLVENVFPKLTSDTTTTTKTTTTSLAPVVTIPPNEHRTDGLNCLNARRKMHQTPILELNDYWNELADKCAKYYARKGEIDHTCPDKGNAGESLFMSEDSKLDPSKLAEHACIMWYDEVKLYDFAKPEFSNKSGHFTQLLWKGSKKVGIGVSSEGSPFPSVVVALYLPRGNVKGKFKENVLPRVRRSNGSNLTGQLTLIICCSSLYTLLTT